MSLLSSTIQISSFFFILSISSSEDLIRTVTKKNKVRHLDGEEQQEAREDPVLLQEAGEDPVLLQRGHRPAAAGHPAQTNQKQFTGSNILFWFFVKFYKYSQNFMFYRNFAKKCFRYRQEGVKKYNGTLAGHCPQMKISRPLFSAVNVSEILNVKKFLFTWFIAFSFLLFFFY